MKWSRKLVPAFIIVALLFATVAPISFAQEQAVPGQFIAAKKTPIVAGPEVYSDSLLTTTVTNLTPGVMYYVKVSVSDKNTLNDVEHVMVTFFYDAAGTDPLMRDVRFDPSKSQIGAAFTWDKNGGTGLWQVVGPASTWRIDAAGCVEPKPEEMTNTSGDWVFAVSPGKVATESVGAADWDLHASATDGGLSAGESYSRNKEMLWYGEILTAAGAKADFGIVDPGTGFADNTNELGGIAITYISNGDYDQRVKSDPTWVGLKNDAIYDDSGAAVQAQRFALMAFGSDTFASAVPVTTGTGGVSFSSTGTQTLETGATVATNTLWLKVANGFSADTYTGNITYIISNR